jgi:uncharacterized integral membrane protein (TIGR00698 family)
MVPPMSRYALFYSWIARLLPGLGITSALAAGATLLGKLSYGSGASPLMIAVLLGVLFRWMLGASGRTRPGVQFAQKQLLRIAIILLGLQLTFDQVASVGGVLLMLIVTVVIATFIFTSWVGKWLRVDLGLTTLIAAGTSICGISAIIASNTVVDARDEDVAYAIATATAFGSVSIFLYPLLAASLPMDSISYATWVGVSLHEVAQVIAAGYAYDDQSGEFAVIVKLTRVLMLAPLVLTIGWLWRPEGSRDLREIGILRSMPIPFFVLGFVAMIAVNSLGLIAPEPKSIMTLVSGFLFAMALAALGLETDLRKLKEKGPRPLMLGALAWIFISGFSLALLPLGRVS